MRTGITQTTVGEIFNTLELLARSESKVRLWMSVGGGDFRDVNNGLLMSAADATTFVKTSESIANEYGCEVVIRIRHDEVWDALKATP